MTLLFIIIGAIVLITIVGVIGETMYGTDALDRSYSSSELAALYLAGKWKVISNASEDKYILHVKRADKFKFEIAPINIFDLPAKKTLPFNSLSEALAHKDRQLSVARKNVFNKDINIDNMTAEDAKMYEKIQGEIKEKFGEL